MLAEKTKGELAQTIAKMKAMRQSAIEKAEKPLKQGGYGLATVAGGALGGVVAGMKPTVFRIPTDGLTGLVLAVPCLIGAGNPGVDALAFGAWGMVAGATNRIVETSTRDWREKRSADAGDTQARDIVTMQANLDAARKARENPKK
jgi:hypothetical protein